VSQQTTHDAEHSKCGTLLTVSIQPTAETLLCQQVLWCQNKGVMVYRMVLAAR
jgi:hypothetical protein